MKFNLFIFENFGFPCKKEHNNKATSENNSHDQRPFYEENY